jgi:hypothetical protein
MRHLRSRLDEQECTRLQLKLPQSRSYPACLLKRAEIPVAILIPANIDGRTELNSQSNRGLLLLHGQVTQPAD